jgi:hypothetical protein
MRIYPGRSWVLASKRAENRFKQTFRVQAPYYQLVTAPATFFVYVPPVPPAPPGPPTTFAPANIQPDLGFPFPDADTAGATDQTFRTIVKPDLWGNMMRFRFPTSSVANR